MTRIPARSLAALGLSLPPRRDQTISTPRPAAVEPLAAVRPPPAAASALTQILRPEAAKRWMMPSVASFTPQYIESILRGALGGSHVQQWELFDLMLDTWPELAGCVQELTTAVQARCLRVEPYADEDEEASEDAVRRAKVASAALRKMRPDPTRDENGLIGTIGDLMSGWAMGTTVSEVLWNATPEDDRALHMVNAGELGQVIAPRATLWLHPVGYAWDATGRLGLRIPSAENAAGQSPFSRPGEVRPFPEHKFIVGIAKAKAGSAAGGARLRALAWWWCAANFSADWLLNLAQLFGLPFRFATYDQNVPQATIDAICAMLQNMGSAGWGAFPSGTQVEFKDVGKNDTNSPQGQLLDRADRYVRMLYLGQTMSGSQDASKGGGKAFGEVETGVKAQRIDAAASYCASVLGQLVESVLVLNFGDAELAPTVTLLEEDYADGAEATRDLALAAGGLAIGEDFLRRKYNLPKPKAGESVIGGKPEPEEPEPEDTAEEDAEDAEEMQAAERKPAGEAAAVSHFAAALAEDLATVRERIAALATIEDDALLTQRAREVSGELARLKADLTKLPASAQALAEIQFAEFFNGLTTAAKRHSKS